MKKYKKLRLYESESLISVLNLGKQALTVVFPENRSDEVISVYWNFSGALIVDCSK